MAGQQRCSKAKPGNAKSKTKPSSGVFCGYPNVEAEKGVTQLWKIGLHNGAKIHNAELRMPNGDVQNSHIEQIFG